MFLSVIGLPGLAFSHTVFAAARSAGSFLASAAFAALIASIFPCVRPISITCAPISPIFCASCNLCCSLSLSKIGLIRSDGRSPAEQHFLQRSQPLTTTFRLCTLLSGRRSPDAHFWPDNPLFPTLLKSRTPQPQQYTGGVSRRLTIDGVFSAWNGHSIT